MPTWIPFLMQVLKLVWALPNLGDIRDMLEQTYCQSIGAEYKYIRNPIKIKWFEDRMESKRNTPSFNSGRKA